MSRQKKKVRQLTRDGVFVKVFDSIKSASATLNINYTTISKCCNYHENTGGGFRFEFLKD